MGAAQQPPVARGGPPRSATTSQQASARGAAVVGLALRFALNATPSGLRRAALRARPTTKNKNQKGDTSNEVTKGTFLKSFDTPFLTVLTVPDHPLSI